MQLIYSYKIGILFIVIICFGTLSVIAQNSQCDMDDWDALKQLFISTNGNNWDNNNNWNTVSDFNSPPTFCDLEQLYGISLNPNGRVAIINLSGNNLSGNLPSEIGNLVDATDINLSLNQLTGAIPSEFSNLTKLEILNLSNNQLVGSIPVSFTFLSTDNGGSMMELILEFNSLSGCYDSDLSVLCAQAYYSGFISSGNNFDAEWDDFCNTGEGSCTCPPSWNLTFGTVQHNNNNVFKASDEIISDAIVAPNVTIIYSAGNRIRLLEGFKARPNTSNSRFTAKIDDCD